MINPPAFLQNSGTTNTAITNRMAANGPIAGLSATVLRGRGGVHSGAGGKFDVQAKPTPDMNVRVKSGIAWVPGTAASATQGMYVVMNDADVDLSIGASSATQNRYDVVYAQVRDTVYSGANNDSILGVAAGTPASGVPTEPSIPSNALMLARVYIPANATTIPNANIDKKSNSAAGLGGVINCTSVTRPSNAEVPDGQLIYETDTDKFWGLQNGTYSQIFTSSDAAFTKVVAGKIFITSRQTTSTMASEAIIGGSPNGYILSSVPMTSGKTYRIMATGGMNTSTVDSILLTLRQATTAGTGTSLRIAIVEPNTTQTNSRSYWQILGRYKCTSTNNYDFILCCTRQTGSVGNITAGSYGAGDEAQFVIEELCNSSTLIES